MTQDVVLCGLTVTDSARKGIAKHGKDELAFFSMEQAFDVHIEKRPENRQGNMSFSIFFDNETNVNLAKQLDNRVAVLECVYKNENFLATGFHVRGRREPIRTNRRLSLRMKFQVGKSIAMPIDFYTSLRELPVAEARSEYVKKRIASWEGYLRIQEKNADVADITAKFSVAVINKDFSKVTLTCNGLKDQEWKTVKGFSVKMVAQQSDFGAVIQTNYARKTIEIELNRKYKDLARRNEWNPSVFNEVVFSNFAELSQVKRLRKGFKDLQLGFAANANLEKILFEERPVVRITKAQNELVFHNELNTFQQEAVIGAMSSNDLYVIQGPPGTGKTTVISEICHQNVKAGLRTLVASQANLAVDNALGRLFSYQDIRILRYGRTESIEEEGKKFIEENVALNWKHQTIEAITEQLQVHAQREAKIEEELMNGEQQTQDLQQQFDEIEAQLRLREQARQDHAVCLNEMTALSEKAAALKDTHVAMTNQAIVLQQTVKDIGREIEKLEELHDSKSMTEDAIKQMETLQQQKQQQQTYIEYRHTAEKMEQVEDSLAGVSKKIEHHQHIMSNLELLLKQLQPITKLDMLIESIKNSTVKPTDAIIEKMKELELHIQSVKSTQSLDSYNDWFELIQRLTKAIETIQKLLNDNGFTKKIAPANRPQRADSVEDINGLISRVGKMLIAPNVKAFLASRSYSSEKYEFLEKMTVGLGVLYQKMNYAKKQIATIEATKSMFSTIKQTMVEQINQLVIKEQQMITELRSEVETLESKIEEFQQQKIAYDKENSSRTTTASISELEEQQIQTEKSLIQYEKEKSDYERTAQEIVRKKLLETELTKEQAQQTADIETLQSEKETLQHAIAAQQQKKVSLTEIMEREIDDQRPTLQKAMEDLMTTATKLSKEKIRLPLTKTIQTEWLSMLKEANDYDLDEIRKLYVQHANVIGTTCVASARRDFVEEYPTFDVVIIDEVSKATPPELLLPMLKGKKIILVGDHHQLPPLVGQETVEEFLEESDLLEDKLELKKLLDESLFERLFRTLPKQNKTMLAIQYRMHETIMETITPFYAEGNYSLQCGLLDSDESRNHLMDSRFIRKDDHLLWFDMPNEEAYFEEKVKGGTSRYNQAELEMVKELLMDLDNATGKLKSAGQMDENQQKSVGVISFYGEQVKRVDRLIQQELMPEHLHCRTGSVDKFQGMEMDIIIVSFVRNHQDKGGDIGFAKDYRRLNVALSRARELLVIVGSSDMFTIRPKDANTKEMYSRLLATIKNKNGFKDQAGIKIG